MKCQFCQQHIREVAAHCWRCWECGVLFITEEESGQIIARNYNLPYRLSNYVIRVNLNTQQLWVGCPDLIDRHIIVKASYPKDNITPQNAVEKLKIYLTFS
jgi:hypothetical protein